MLCCDLMSVGIIPLTLVEIVLFSSVRSQSLKPNFLIVFYARLLGPGNIWIEHGVLVHGVFGMLLWVGFSSVLCRVTKLGGQSSELALGRTGVCVCSLAEPNVDADVLCCVNSELRGSQCLVVYLFLEVFVSRQLFDRIPGFYESSGPSTRSQHSAA